MRTLSAAAGAERERAVSAAASAARRGDLVLLPTESVYALATDPFSTRGVAAIRSVKGLAEHAPLPLMVPSAATVHGIASGVTPTVQALMEAFWPGPLTLLLPGQPSLAWDLPSHLPVTVRMPIHPVTLAVLERTGPLIVTAANAPGQPGPTSIEAATQQLGECAAIAIDTGELVSHEGPSTVVDVTGVIPRVVRPGALSVTLLREVAPEIAD
ncbi:MAG: L-threonylcarbamoyladenylate synthase [Candidatus Nanopelagicales bacterium]|nr:L-threonylcarbamoyladenylate synthase [Candidatus Nanopelagicales bacterium]